jgi:hypothetical protein
VRHLLPFAGLSIPAHVPFTLASFPTTLFPFKRFGRITLVASRTKVNNEGPTVGTAVTVESSQAL